jgi:hypothetical protein
VVNSAQRPSHSQLKPGSHRLPHLVWRSGPTQPGHPRIVFVAHFRAGLQWKREPKSATLGRAELSPPATMDSGVQRESGRGVRFGSRRPGPGREKQSQTRDCAPGGAAEPQSHPSKHPLRVRLVGGMWPGQALQMQPLSDWLDAHQLQPGRQDAKGDQSVKNAGSDRFRLDRLQPAAMRARLLGPTVRLRACLPPCTTTARPARLGQA